jgi:hypothetical protein
MDSAEKERGTSDNAHEDWKTQGNVEIHGQEDQMGVTEKSPFGCAPNSQRNTMSGWFQHLNSNGAAKTGRIQTSWAPWGEEAADHKKE